MARIFEKYSLLFLAALVGPIGHLHAQQNPSPAQILEALKPKAPPAGATTRALRGRDIPAPSDAAFIEGLRNRQTRLLSIEEKSKAAEIARARPSIDLEITFDYDSDVIGPRSVPILVSLGTALRCGDLAGSIFLVSGHTDAQGGEAYNQELSERRAEAVRRFLVARFGIAPENLVPIGYGETQPKNAADPNGAENRRVQIVNTEIKAAGWPERR